MMWWIFAVIGLMALVVALVMRAESLAAEHKRLMVQLKIQDQDSAQFQQFTYELAEEFCQFMLLQLGAARRLSRIPPEDIQLFEHSIQLIPLLCKELAGRKLAFRPAIQRALKAQAELDVAQLDATANRYGRLINGWQQQNLVGYLQMCQQMCILTKEIAHKEHFKSGTTVGQV